MRNTSSHSTAILVFARTANEEIRHKKVAKNGRLFDELTEHTLQTVRKTGLPFFHVTERMQQGQSFGERFTNAIQAIFEHGFENVITVGNDSPHLNRAHLELTLTHLKDNNSVIGPSADGGFYLLGLHKSQFNVSDFKKLSWQTSALFTEVCDLVGARGEEPIILNTLFDLDNLEDLRLFFNRFKNFPSNLFAILHSLCTSIDANFRVVYLLVDDYLSKIFYNKGSPLILHF